MQLSTFTRYVSLLLLLFVTNYLSGQLPSGGVAYLSGQQEVLPVATTASGMVDVSFEEVAGDMIQVTVTGSFSGLSSPVDTDINGGAHIHMGYAGRNGGIVVPLQPTLDTDMLGGSFDNTVEVMASAFEGVGTGMLYVNIHTQNYPGGEIRGAIVSGDDNDDGEFFYANLFGSNEVPSVLSRASGALVLELNDDNDLTVTGSFRDLSDTLASSIRSGAHLHLGLPGQNGGIDIELMPTTEDGDTSGIFTAEMNTVEDLDDDQVEALRSGRYYANIHSGTFPSGEIRGQVLPPAEVLFRAHLSGSNEWPVVTSGGSGQVLAHLRDGTVSVIGSFSDLGAAVNTDIAGGAHLHPGYAGQNGPVAIELDLNLDDDDEDGDDNTSGNFALTENAYDLTDAQLALMLDRGIYLNIHSLDHAAGEIRGQVLPESQAVFTAFLNGNQQIPSVTTTGRGLVKVELLGERMTVTGSFQGLMSDLNTDIDGGSHLHAGYPGQGGPVIYPLNATQEFGDTAGVYMPMGNTFMIGSGGVDTLMRRFFYTNVHSMNFPGGEIRGSVLAEAESYFLAPLSGASEPQGVPTQATGMVAAEVVDSSLTLVGSFMGLDSDFAADVAGGMHLHQSIAGRNGGILQGINTEVSNDSRSAVILADSNKLALTTDNLTALLDRMVYANVHTADYRGGAIRGQMLPLAGSYFHTTFSGANATNYVMTTAQGGLKLELINSMLMVSGSVSDLDGDYDESIRNGAHLHLAPAGQNGGIVIPLNPDVDEDLKGARFLADSNTYTIADSVQTALRTGRLYANVHTTTVASGEARGQIRSELNLPPLTSSILSPMDGDSLALASPSTDTFLVSYASTTDPDMDTVIYVWQLATDEAFDNVIFGVNTGRDTFFQTDFGTVGLLLDDNEIAADSMITLYHRVLASDGSNYTPSAASMVTLNGGDVVSTRNYLPEGFSAQTFPNPVRGGQAVSYRLTTGEAFTGRLLLYSALGQLQREIDVDASVGSRIFPIQTENLAPGQYFLTLRNEDGRLIQASRIVVQ